MDRQMEAAQISTTAVTDGDILPILLRYRDQHQWSWNLSKRLINMQFGTQYTEKQLKSLYKKRK